MTAAQQQGWEVLLDAALEFPEGWCLVGGQMVWLHAAEHGVTHLAPPKTSTSSLTSAQLAARSDVWAGGWRVMTSLLKV
jgi:hypothetical protein